MKIERRSGEGSSLSPVAVARKVNEVQKTMQNSANSVRNRAILQTLMETGCRASEIPEIEYLKGELKIPHVKHASKTHSYDRYYRPSSELESLFIDLCEESPAKPLKDLDASRIHRIIDKYADKAGVERESVSPQKLRRTKISTLLKIVPPYAVNLVFGHTFPDEIRGDEEEKNAILEEYAEIVNKSRTAWEIEPKTVG